MSGDKSTNIIDGASPSRARPLKIPSELSALFQLIGTNNDSALRANAVDRLIQLINTGREEVHLEEIKELLDSEKDIRVATKLLRLLNKIKIGTRFPEDPTSKYDRKLSSGEEEKLLEEIERIRGFYDRSMGEDGSFVKKYKVIRKIAEGGMGDIFHGIRIRDNSPVAIKYLRLERFSLKTNAETMVARFRREGELLSKVLDHENILKAYEYGEADGEYLIIMEYVEGGTLEEMIDEGFLDPESFFRMAFQLCDAVDCLHRHGIIHRDIKPDNILLEKGKDFPRIKLADLGLAKDKANKKISRCSFSAGTEEYSSPQQWLDARTADERDDIYSMGKTFYQMLTRKTFKPDSQYESIGKHMTNSPDELDSIIRKCITADREERFQTVAELKNSLQELYRRRDL